MGCRRQALQTAKSLGGMVREKPGAQLAVQLPRGGCSLPRIGSLSLTPGPLKQSLGLATPPHLGPQAGWGRSSHIPGSQHLPQALGEVRPAGPWEPGASVGPHRPSRLPKAAGGTVGRAGKPLQLFENTHTWYEQWRSQAAAAALAAHLHAAQDTPGTRPSGLSSSFEGGLPSDGLSGCSPGGQKQSVWKDAGSLGCLLA